MPLEIKTKELELVEPSRALAIKETFDPMVKMLENFEGAYNEIVVDSEKEITNDVVKRAKRVRLDIAKIRVSADKVRKEQKEEYLRAGQAIDGAFKILKWAVTDKEEKLKGIEDHFENLERIRLEKLQSERVALIVEFLPDANERDLSNMSDDVWDAYFSSKKKIHLDTVRAEKIRFENKMRRIEEERLAEIEIAKVEARKQAEKEKAEAEAELKKALARAEEEKRQRTIDESHRKEQEEIERKRVLEENARIQKEAEDRHARELIKAKEDAIIEAEKQAESKRLQDEADRKEAEAKEAERMVNMEYRKKIHISIKDHIVKYGVDKLVAGKIVESFMKDECSFINIKY